MSLNAYNKQVALNAWLSNPCIIRSHIHITSAERPHGHTIQSCIIRTSNTQPRAPSIGPHKGFEMDRKEQPIMTELVTVEWLCGLSSSNTGARYLPLIRLTSWQTVRTLSANIMIDNGWFPCQSMIDAAVIIDSFQYSVKATHRAHTHSSPSSCSHRLRSFQAQTPPGFQPCGFCSTSLSSIRRFHLCPIYIYAPSTSMPVRGGSVSQWMSISGLIEHRAWIG